MSTAQSLARIGAAATFIGAVLLIVSTVLHPLDSDAADAPAAFAEYAADPHYVWTHLGQFVGFFGSGWVWSRSRAPSSRAGWQPGRGLAQPERWPASKWL